MTTWQTKRATVPAAEEILGMYFPVLDGNGFVSLVDYHGSDKSIERSARCSYNFEEKDRTDKDTNKLIRHLFRERHSSPGEFVGVTLHVGLPLFVARQLFRHRTLKINEFSGRYSVMPLLFYTPPSSRLQKQSKTNNQGSSSETFSLGDYDSYLEDVEFTRGKIADLYKNNLNEDMARELARIDLPLSLYTYCYINIDVRNLFHLIGLRSDSHAQSETREYSDIFGGIAKRVAPMATQAFLDYHFNSVNFTYIEMEALRRFYTGFNQPSMEGFLKNNGCTNREISDFWNKLENKTTKDFNLDLSAAKPADHFYNLIKENAVEIPNE